MYHRILVPLDGSATAERGLLQLHARYGAVDIARYVEALHGYAEAMMRDTIRELPNGIYVGEDYLDGIGDHPDPILIRATVTIDDDSIDIDFAGTSGQVKASINCPISLPESAAFTAIRCLSHRDIPNCDGYLKPITVRAPEGCLLNPVYPAACGARGVVGHRVFDAIMRALAQVVPERAIAGSEGGPFLMAAGGNWRGRQYVLNEMLVGTWGARADRDGIEGISNPAANLSNQPIEMIEAEMPVEVLRYGFVEDSGGPGRNRGGLAFTREFRFLEATTFNLRGDRRDHPPYGLEGGGAGAPSAHVHITASGENNLPTMPMRGFAAAAGDVFRLVGAGGGGYGDAMTRDPERVLADVVAEKVSIDGARRDYGVVIDPVELRVDTQATETLRAGATP